MLQTLTRELTQVMPSAKKTGLFVSLATFQVRTGNVDALGQQDLVNWTNVSGLVNVPCQLSAMSIYRPDISGVIRAVEGFEEISQRHLLLNGYYPTVQKQYTVLVDGTRYEVMDFQFDSQNQQTRLAVRVYQR